MHGSYSHLVRPYEMEAINEVMNEGNKYERGIEFQSNGRVQYKLPGGQSLRGCDEILRRVFAGFTNISSQFVELPGVF